jgi:UDP-N-acetylmuramoyl-tripeptide--D-alanyl-D-alanine ligase
MKSKKIKILEIILRRMAITVLKKYQPTIIGITGSVGKTSTKEAIYLVLADKFKVRKNEKNYNNEIGIPLTVIGCESGNRSLLKWIRVFWHWLIMIIIRREYPEILILEMGVDAPGDMKYLTSFIHPKVGVVTNISSSHLEYFRDLDHIAKEKGILIEKLPKDGFAVINIDDKRVSGMIERISAEMIMKYGNSEAAQVRSSDINYAFTEEDLAAGISFKLNYEGKSIPVRLHHIVAEHQIYAALAAVSIGIIFKINLVNIAKSLEEYYPPAGRMNLITGINSTMIIDDTYNASPVSTVAALDVLGKINAKRKIVVLGDMLELGSDEEQGHRKVGGKIAEIKADLFFAVGRRMKFAVEEVKKNGYPSENIFEFDSPDEAGKKVQEIIEAGDLVLVKGSQGMRMEKVVEMIVADIKQAEGHMCRQTKDWHSKLFRNP